VRIIERMQNAYSQGKIADPGYHDDLTYCQSSIEITAPCTSLRPLTDERGKPRAILSSSNNNLNSSNAVQSSSSYPSSLHSSGENLQSIVKPKAIAALKVNVKQHRASQKLTFQPPCKPIPSKVEASLFFYVLL
jgi:hypothetical protein